MMPVIKNDYNIYPSCPSSRNSTPQSSRGSSLASSPTATSLAFRSSPRSSETPGFPKSESQISMHKFHSKLLDRLKKTFRGKDVSEDNQASTSSAIAIRWYSLFLSEAKFFLLSFFDGIENAQESIEERDRWMTVVRKSSASCIVPCGAQQERSGAAKPDDGSIWSWCHLSSWSTTEWLLICNTLKYNYFLFPQSSYIPGFNRSSVIELFFNICPRTVSELSQYPKNSFWT